MTAILRTPPRIEESINPRERRLARAARMLGVGALAYIVIALLCIVGAGIAAAAGAPGVFDALRGIGLIGYAGAADVAVGIIILGVLLDAALLLVLMVGLSAREIWALPGIAAAAIFNIGALIVFGFTPALLALVLFAWTAVMLIGDLGAFRVNPVMLKELRGRMRGARAFVVLSIYLTLMSGFAMLLYLIYQSGAGGGSAAAGAIGRILFVGVFGIELILIVFIAPAFTAGAITGERERQTYDLLRTTLLASPSFVMGKLESALGYIVLLLLAGLPLQSIAFLFGGVSELELLLGFVILTVTAIILGTVGIYFSAVMARTLAASVRAYGVIVVAMFILPLVLSILANLLRQFVIFGAVSAPLEGLLVYVELLLTAFNPVVTALTTQSVLIERNTLSFWTYTLQIDGSLIPMVSPWIPFTILYLTVSALLLALAIRRIRRSEG